MEEAKRKTIAAIRHDLSDRFRVIDNTGNARQIIGGVFPDVLLMRQEPPKNEDVLFVMRIESMDVDLSASIVAWKELERSEISFYLVIPADKLNEAKRLASVLDVPAKFASYVIDCQGKVKVNYE